MDVAAQQTDSDIVKRALRDKEAFGVLIMRYEEKLDRYFKRLGVYTAEDRQDILQEVFIKTYKNLNEFDTTLTFSSWIYRIAHNETMSWYRKRRVRPEGHLVDEGEEVLMTIGNNENNAEILLDHSINAEHLSSALADIDQKYRDVIVLRFFEHKEYGEISDILKIPTGSVATLLHRAKKRLKDNLAHINT